METYLMGVQHSRKLIRHRSVVTAEIYTQTSYIKYLYLHKMITAYGRRRLKKIAITFIALILCVQFVVFITSTFQGQRHIFVYESGVCNCEADASRDFKDKVIDSKINEIDSANKSAQEISEHIERIRQENTANNRRKFSSSSRVALTDSIDLRRPIVVRSTVKMTPIKSDLIIAKTNHGNSTRTDAGHSTINMTLSTVKYIPAIEKDGAGVMDRSSPTGKARSIEGNNPQPSTRKQKKKQSELLPEHTVKKTPANENTVPPHRLEVVKEPITIDLPSIQIDKRAPSSRVSKVPLTTVEDIPPQALHDGILRTVKSPIKFRETSTTVNPTVKKTHAPKVTKALRTTAKKLPQPNIKKSPSSLLKTVNLKTLKAPLPASKNVSLPQTLGLNKTPFTVNKQVPIAKKIPMSTTKKVQPVMKTIKQRTVKAPLKTSRKSVPFAQKLKLNRTTPTPKSALPTAKKIPLPTIKKVPFTLIKTVKQQTIKASLNISPVPRETPPATKAQTVKQTRTNNTINVKSENKITTASTSEFSWKTLTKTLSIFSSYLDSRYLKTKEGLFPKSLVIFGYEIGIFSRRNLYCVVIMQDDERLMLKEPALRITLAESWRAMQMKYRAIMYRCNLTTPKTPRYVTLIDDTGSNTELHAIPQANFISVVDPHFAGVTHEFGVCYETPLYGNKYDQGIMDSIEMNKLLGATWFTIYVYEANEKALEILSYYSQKLKILDALLNWGENIPSPVYNRGLLAGVHDCVYRNMYKVRYLVLCDLDEIIMPTKSLNWHELLLKIDKPKLGYFAFHHLGFHKNMTKSTELLHCPGQSNLTYKMPRFFATHNRSVSVISKYRQMKSIAKPRYSIVVHVHYSKTMLPGYKAYCVPTDKALMKHFRDKDDPRYKNYNSTLDFSMDRFKPAILAAIEEHYCRNIKHVPR